jgi:hypothetical protein
LTLQTSDYIAFGVASTFFSGLSLGAADIALTAVFFILTGASFYIAWRRTQRE